MIVQLLSLYYVEQYGKMIGKRKGSERTWLWRNLNDIRLQKVRTLVTTAGNSVEIWTNHPLISYSNNGSQNVSLGLANHNQERKKERKKNGQVRFLTCRQVVWEECKVHHRDHKSRLLDPIRS